MSLEEPAISSDGRRVAFIAVRADYAHDRSTRELWVADVRSGRLQLLARGNDVAVPRWSPDGSVLAYLARTRDGHMQVVRGESSPRALTHAVNDVADFAWRPDGGAIAFAASDAPAKGDYFEPGDTDYTLTALTPPVHLWTMDADGSHPRRLTDGSWTVAPTDAGGIFTPQFAWSPDGRAIYYTRLENTASGDDEYSHIERLDLRSGETTPLTAHRSVELTPQPAGAAIAYWYPQDGDFLAQNQLHVLRDGTDTILSQSLDRNVGGSVWLPGGAAMLVCGDDRARSVSWQIGLDGSVRDVALGGLSVECDSYSDSTFDAGIAASFARDGTLAFVATDASHEDELYVAASLRSAPRRLTHFNDWLQSRTLGAVRTISWNGPQGQKEYGVVTYPPTMRAGVTYPVTIAIHGGPGQANTTALTAWPRAQLFAARGYIVLQPNYRGSDDAGNAYMISIEGDTVRGPADDITTALTALEADPNVDGSRASLGGWSYGGLLTSWLITQRHDFRAAVSGAAVNDETEEYAFSVSNVQNRYYLKASPYAAGGAKIYADQSPLTFAGSVTTPTLIWSTTGDPVVPTTMSYTFYHALREHHTPVRFVEFVAPTHGPNTPRQTEEITAMWLQWLDRYSK